MSIVSGRNVNIADNRAITLGASTVSGNLTITATTINQSGALNVSGTGNTVFNATSTTVGNITLTNTRNNFSGAVSLNGNGVVSIADLGALKLGASYVNGTLNVVTNGALTQNGSLNVTGTTTLATGLGDITLTTTGNRFSGRLAIMSANNVTLNAAGNQATGNLTLGPVFITGNLALTASSNLTDYGQVIVLGTGTSTLNVGLTHTIHFNDQPIFGGPVVIVCSNPGSTGM